MAIFYGAVYGVPLVIPQNEVAALPELTNPAAAEQIVEGYEAINSEGAVVTGSNPYEKVATDAEATTQAGLIAQIQAALEGKTAGGGSDDDTLKSIIDRTLTDIELPSGLTKIGDYAFAGMSRLNSVSIPNGVTSIGMNAFFSSSIKTVSLPNTLTGIDRYAFSGCANLSLESLPSNLTIIGSSAFAGCTSLALTSLPEGITSIDSNAFIDCTGLTTLTFEGTPTSIGEIAFGNCTNLTTINVPWAEGEVANAPWGATNATINYNYTGEA